jgi:hypothetical protein
MTDRELIRQTLFALECNLPVLEDYGDKDQLQRQHTAITALRDRLAQPEQELVIDCPRCGHCCPQPNQEPVAHVEYIPCCTDQSCPKCKTATPPAAQPEQNCVGWFGYDTGVRAWFETNKGDDDSIPLYKAPRPWVGLTDDDYETLSQYAFVEVIEKVEAFLKEKNT